jgi:hypothetical protein
MRSPATTGACRMKTQEGRQATEGCADKPDPRVRRLPSHGLSPALPGGEALAHRSDVDRFRTGRTSATDVRARAFVRATGSMPTADKGPRPNDHHEDLSLGASNACAAPSHCRAAPRIRRALNAPNLVRPLKSLRPAQST